MVAAANKTSIGMETLEEEEEKSRFFAQLEAGASSTIDYSNLNRELDSTSSTIGTNLRYVNGLAMILHPLSTIRQIRSVTWSHTGRRFGANTIVLFPRLVKLLVNLLVKVLLVKV